MSHFAVNPHTLRVAAQAFSAAEARVDLTLARFQGRGGIAAGAIGDSTAAATYERLHGDHVTALRNLRDSLHRVARELLQAALRYDQSDHDFIVSGDEQP